MFLLLYNLFFFFLIYFLDFVFCPNERKYRKRKVISLALKVEILDRLKRGEGATSVGRYYNLNEATVRTIKKNEKNIRARASAGFELESRCPPRFKSLKAKTKEGERPNWAAYDDQNGQQF